jgi:hypothetical protein
MAMACRSEFLSAGTPIALPLIQIKTGLSARWNGLNLSVEGDSGQWKLQVQDSCKIRTLYSAQRSSAKAAQVAAADFALLFSGSPAERPEALAKELAWSKYW